MMQLQDKQKLNIKLESSPVNVGESFPKGVMFKKAEIQYKFDREAKKLTDEKDAISVTATDVETLEDFTVKLPLDTKLPEQLKPFQPVEFVNLTGMRIGYNIYLKADSIKQGQ